MPQTQTLGFKNQPIPTSYREQIPRLRRFGLGDSEAQASDYLKQPRGSLTSHSVLEQVKSTIETLSRNHLFQLRQVINKKLESYG